MKWNKTMAVLAAATMFGLAACGSEIGGAAKPAGGEPGVVTPRSASDQQTTPDASSGDQQTDSSDGAAGTDTESPAAGGGADSNDPQPTESSDSTTSVETSDGAEQGGDEAVTTSESSSEPAPTTSASTPAPATSSSAASGSADAWPKDDLCKLMPADLVKGLEKQDGDPQMRCFYAGNIDTKYHGVMITRGGFKVSPDDPSGNNSGKQIKTSTIDGRKGWSWFTGTANTALATFDSGDESALILVANEAKSPEETRTAALALAASVSKALRSGKMTGAVTAPPTTSYPKVPAGTRAWPHVICEVMPAQLLSDMEKARGYEDQSCRLRTDTKTGFVSIDVHREVDKVDPADPTMGMGKSVKKDTIDGRQVYSYLNDSGTVPTAFVLFDTGADESASIRYAESDAKTTIDPEKVRADALALAKQIAPKLPKP